MPESRKAITIHCIGNAHIDPVWRWGWQEGYAETLATCRAALDRLRECEDFIFSRGQAATYAWIEEADPELFEEIRHYVRLGRWKLVNGWWEQPDCNIPAGESYVRHALYGKNWFQDRFGVEVTIGWNPDTFGHTIGLPQILKKSGFEAYCFFRPGKHEKVLPGPYFRWQGPDGSQIIAIRPPAGHYGTGGGDLSDSIVKSGDAARTLSLAHSILFYGVGNHGGGPTRKNLESIRAVQADPDGPTAVFSSAEAFVQKLQETPERLPVVTDDLQHHAPGCYTTHSEIKALNRLTENRLMRAERWYTLVSRLLDLPPAQAEFEQAWKQLLFNQFHDVLAGTSLPSAYDDAREQLGEALSIAARLENRALQRLALQIDTRVDAAEPPSAGIGRPILLFNPSSSNRVDSVEVQWGWGTPWDQPGGTGQLLDEDGSTVPFDFVQPDIFDGGTRIRFEPQLPPLGYRVYRLMPDPAHDAAFLAQTADEAASAQQDPTASSAMDTESEKPQAGQDFLENRFWRLEFNRETGFLSRIYDKILGLELLQGEGCGLRVMDDPGDTWGHDIESWHDEAGKFVGRLDTQGNFAGNTYASMRLEQSWGKSTAVVTVMIYRETPRIDVDLVLNWQEQRKLLKFVVPTTIINGVLTCDSAYSAIVRRTNGKEDPVGSWLDLSGAAPNRVGQPITCGLALLNTDKYGYDCLNGELRLSLLRSPIYCFHDPAQIDPSGRYEYMDQGRHEIRLSLMSHPGSWQDAGVQREAHHRNNPVQYVFQYPHSGSLGPRTSLLQVHPERVQSVVIKRSEKGQDLILRLFESGGRPADAGIQFFDSPEITLRMTPWELKTVRIHADGTAEELDLLERPM